MDGYTGMRVVPASLVSPCMAFTRRFKACGKVANTFGYFLTNPFSTVVCLRYIMLMQNAAGTKLTPVIYVELVRGLDCLRGMDGPSRALHSMLFVLLRALTRAP